MAVAIPIVREADGPSYFDLQVALDGETYTLEFRWNERMASWFLAVLDAEATTAHAVGIRLVTDWPLAQYTAARIPSGVFILVDTATPDGFGVDPGFDDLGNRHVLHYVPLSELV